MDCVVVLEAIRLIMYFFSVSKKAGKEEKEDQQKTPEEDTNAPPKEPEPFEFSAQMPAMSAQDL